MTAWQRLAKGLSFLATIAVLSLKTRAAGSPEPFVRWLRRQPDPGPPVPPPELAECERAVDVLPDVPYPSQYRSNALDIYYPKDARSPRPTIVWIHGGSFVAGDKAGTAYWCTLMASKGYAVVSMNYETAPEARYPAPVVQMTEVCEHLSSLAELCPALDARRLIIGGDSAGAQIASQFLALQTNPELARLAGIRQSVPPSALQAALLYCGPYDIKRLAEAKGTIGRFFMNQLGWAYIGERKWMQSAKARQASTVDHITARYPPVFVTDGNTGSFESHGRELEARLRSANVKVASLFFPPSEGVVHHEYQFKLDTPQARTCLDMTLAFLDECLNQRQTTARL